MSNQPYKVPPPLPLNCGNIFAHCQFRKSVKSKLFLPLSLSQLSTPSSAASQLQSKRRITVKIFTPDAAAQLRS